MPGVPVRNTQGLNIEQLCRECGFDKIITMVQEIGINVEHRLKMLYQYHVRGRWIELSDREDELLLIDDMKITVDFLDNPPTWN